MEEAGAPNGEPKEYLTYEEMEAKIAEATGGAKQREEALTAEVAEIRGRLDAARAVEAALEAELTAARKQLQTVAAGAAAAL